MIIRNSKCASPIHTCKLLFIKIHYIYVHYMDSRLSGLQTNWSKYAWKNTNCRNKNIYEVCRYLRLINAGYQIQSFLYYIGIYYTSLAVKVTHFMIYNRYFRPNYQKKLWMPEVPTILLSKSQIKQEAKYGLLKKI